jgi:HAD superfamily hydrolase (TIGR01490 family)
MPGPKPAAKWRALPVALPLALEQLDCVIEAGMAIAFFDLDKTLFPQNSASLWVKSELRLGFLSRWQALRVFGWLMRYHLGFADMEDAIRRSIASLKGDREEDIRERTLAFYDAEMRGRFRPGGLAALERHRAAGDACVLLTSTSNYLSSPTAAELGLDSYLCNRFRVDDEGLFTGDPVEPLCFGTGKVAHAKRYAAEHGFELDACVYYGDSHSDRQILEAVGRPVAVNPDPRLARLARQRGWEIVDWGGA